MPKRPDSALASPAPSPPQPGSLQVARKAFARARIRDAARDLFFRQGYAATTFEQIAKAAGTRRTTLYSHFADKGEILEAIGKDYSEALVVVVEQLEGPVPTRAQIDAWIARLVAFVESERAPATLVIGLGVSHDAPAVVETVTARFREALCARLPAFAAAFEHGDAQARGRVKLILRELSLGCLEAARGEEEGWAVLAVVAELLERFVREDA